MAGGIVAAGAVALFALVVDRRGRLGRAIAWGAFALGAGCSLAWGRASWIAAPVLTRPVVAEVTGRIALAEPQPAREAVRLTLDVVSASIPSRSSRAQSRGAAERSRGILGSARTGVSTALDMNGAGVALPPRVRLNLDQDKAPPGLDAGAVIAVRARLVPPPPAAVPGAYDFARVAWFQRLGATGKALDPPRIVAPAGGGGAGQWLAGARVALTRHIEAQLAGSTGGVAAAFVTGDVGAIGEDEADAMRRSGLAHLLSISGLHVAAVIAATMWLTLRLLALSP